MYNDSFKQTICQVTGATELFKIEKIQSLWSGYGDIVRYGLRGSDSKTIIVKHVQLPDQAHHPRGWNTDISHQRKLKSYKVEMAWYSQFGQFCDDGCRIPHCLAVESAENEMLMVLEDLDDSGFPVRKNTVSMGEMKVCLSWLANFHATFMNRKAHDLWDTGTYWHLDTRPDELEALDDIELKKAAVKIDQKLKESPYQTIVHGDAKLANFCFSGNGKQVAAVDFQYVGAGCGMKDVAYFIGSCLYENDCEIYETELLDFYFYALKQSIISKKITVDAEQVELDWRALYPVAWTDFHRFIKGWSPGHWKIHGYSERVAQQVITQLNEVTE